MSKRSISEYGILEKPLSVRSFVTGLQILSYSLIQQVFIKFLLYIINYIIYDMQT